MARNPFLPKRPTSPTKWLTGPARGTVGIPRIPESSTDLSTPNGYQKSNRGRKPKRIENTLPPPELPWWDKPWRRKISGSGDHHPFLEMNGGEYGTLLDIFALSHGAVGCSAHALTQRLHAPSLLQGIETFTALDACTDLRFEDFSDNGNAKLNGALNELLELFPLARGLAVLDEPSVTQIGTDISGIVKTRTKSGDRLFIARSYGAMPRIPSLFQSASRFLNVSAASPYDVALANCGPDGHVWIIDKLLRDIGLNPIHADASSSRVELAQIGQCKLVIGAHTFRPDPPENFRVGSMTHTLGQLFHKPVFWGCFATPAETDASLRKIAAYFGSDIQARAEAVIEANKKKVYRIIATYKPRLQGKLFLNFWMSDDKPVLECFRLLGMRVGSREGWPGKTGIPRKPRRMWRYQDEESLRSYVAEAKPDLAYIYLCDPDEWIKRGVAALPLSPMLNYGFHMSCGYEGFALLAASLDRHINAPWRKLVKAPWA